MHISKLNLVNYRNFSNTELLFNKGINTVIGENGSGKTNLFRAIRLLLDDNMLRSAYKLCELDFNRSLGPWKGHWIIISIEFEELSLDEEIQALFIHGVANISSDSVVDKGTYNLIFRPKKDIRLKLSKLSYGDHDGLNSILSEISLTDYETVFTGKSTADFNDSHFYRKIAGDFENAIFCDEIEHPEIGIKVPGILSVAKEVSFTFIQALRDVVSEFHNNRTNPLLTLLKSKSGKLDPTVIKPITDKVLDLNESIENLKDVQDVRADISKTIKDTVGETYSPKSMSIRSDLPAEAEALFQSLKLFIGESDGDYEGGIHELSLGGANLIYLTLKLLEFNYQVSKQSCANFLLIEEPEAHIHTHIQKALFDKVKYPNTQIIYSTHSTHISEVSNVSNINVLGLTDGCCEAYQPTNNLSPKDIGRLQRYLDAVRSNLLFAKSVILVEGDAEEILIPTLVKKLLGISLDELGISLVNIRSTGFKNVAILFNDDRIRKKCSIITDLDSAIVDTTPNPLDSSAVSRFKKKSLGSDVKGKTRKLALDNFCSGNVWLNVFYASNTFEVDFITAGNSKAVINIVEDVYDDISTIKKSKIELASNDKSIYGKRVLTMAENEGKGWFAILLGNNIDDQVHLPGYILDAITNASPLIKEEIWLYVLSYRLSVIKERRQSTDVIISWVEQELGKYRTKKIDTESIFNTFIHYFPNDSVVEFIKRYKK
jgi:putative ATP-dependent endonuclease of OLD family